MLVIPAIDLKDGQCVRLRQGRMEDATVYSDDPVAVATRWVKAGARRLHVVDLNGAFAGEPVNADAVRRIVEAHPDIPVQVGGGIRDEESIETYLDVGVQYVILGTKAVRDPHQVNDFCLQYPGHIMVGLDSRDGRVAVEGWSKLARHDLLDLAQRFERDGVEAIIHTDISRDGMLQGMNLKSTVALAQSVTIPVIASGGVSTLDDIRELCRRRGDGISGAILGRSLYEGSIDLGEALAVVERFDEAG